jgi:hypothetical protein
MSLPSIDTKLVKELRQALRNSVVAVQEIDDVIVQFTTDWSGDAATFVDVVLNVKNEANWRYETYKLVENTLKPKLQNLAPENLVYFSFIDKRDLPIKYPELVGA